MYSGRENMVNGQGGLEGSGQIKTRGMGTD